MANRVIITCPHYSEGAGGVATFYKVYAEKQTQNARLFYIGKDKPCGILKTLWQLIIQYVHLFLILPKYDLLVVNPSLKPNAIKRDTVSVKMARWLGKKTCVFWRGFNEDYFNNVVRYQFKEKLQKGLFNVDYSIVLGKNIYDKYHSIGLNTPYSLGSTMLDEHLLKTTPKTFKEGHFAILFLARIIKEKGIFETLQAFKEFHETHPNTSLTIAGDGEDYPKMPAYIRQHHIQGVTIMGDVRSEKKKACFDAADVYLFPSYTEGMPNSVLEALGMGLPIITTEVGAVPDFFEDGKMGILIQNHSSEEILNALEMLYNKKEQFREISDYNRDYAAHHFVDRVVIRRLEDIFNTI